MQNTFNILYFVQFCTRLQMYHKYKKKKKKNPQFSNLIWKSSKHDHDFIIYPSIFNSCHLTFDFTEHLRQIMLTFCKPPTTINSAIHLARHWLQAVYPLLIRLRRRGTIVSSNSLGRVISRAGQRSGGIFARQRNSERALKRARRDGSSGRFNSKLQFGLCQTTLKRITHGRRWPDPIEYSGHVHARVYHSRFTRDGARPQRESSRACSERNTRNRACTSNLSFSLCTGEFDDRTNRLLYRWNLSKMLVTTYIYTGRCRGHSRVKRLVVL